MFIISDSVSIYPKPWLKASYMSNGKSSTPDLMIQIRNRIINYVFSDKLITQFPDEVYHVNQRGHVVYIKAMLQSILTHGIPKKLQGLRRNPYLSTVSRRRKYQHLFIQDYSK